MATDIEIANDALSRQQTFDDKPVVADSDFMTLRRVPDKLPKIALLILAVEVRLKGQH